MSLLPLHLVRDNILPCLCYEDLYNLCCTNDKWKQLLASFFGFNPLIALKYIHYHGLEEALLSFTRNDYLDGVRLIHDTDPEEFRLICNDYLDGVRLIHDTDDEKDYDSLFRHAAICNSTKVAKYLLDSFDIIVPLNLVHFLLQHDEVVNGDFGDEILQQASPENIRKAQDLYYEEEVTDDIMYVFQTWVTDHESVLELLAERRVGFGEPKKELEIASELGYDSVFRRLIDSTSEEETLQYALMCCCKRGDIDTAQVLMNRTSLVTQDGRALVRACQSGHYDLAKLLLQRGSPLSWYSEQSSEERRVLQEVVDFPDGDEKLEIIQLLLDAGAEIDQSTLFYACREGSAKVLRMLLENKPNVDLDQAALHRDSRMTFRILEVLLDYGIFQETKNKFLERAVYSGNKERLKLLLQSGADPTKGDIVPYAAYCQHCEILQILLEHNIPSEVKNKALYCASYLQKEDAMQLLKDAGAEIRPLPSSANAIEIAYEAIIFPKPK